MFRHRVVDVKVLEINNKVLSGYGWYYDVPMKYVSREVGFCIGDWSINVILYPPIVSCNLCVSFFWGWGAILGDLGDWCAICGAVDT